MDEEVRGQRRAPLEGLAALLARKGLLVVVNGPGKKKLKVGKSNLALFVTLIFSLSIPAFGHQSELSLFPGFFVGDI